MAMNQSVVSSRFPYLPIHLQVRINRTTDFETDLEALLDTGFDGDVVVPANFPSNGHVPEAFLRWILADGSQVEAAAYRGTLYIGNIGPISVVVTALGDESMIGRKAITRFTVTLDHGQRVIVEP
ncbi:MAG: hypothetical protein HW403_70 [Dehalococcoidia bacterium]|nr:hypothetical protein [Dehalococcoidia bacterium]